MGTQRLGYVPEVDSLRALAALAVVLFHEGCLPYGWVGVWVFFVLSGFVITRMMIGSQWTLSYASYKAFMVRRAARIWPLYFLFIAVGLLTLKLSENGFAGGWPEIAGLFTFTYNFVMAFEPATFTLGHLWTISVEQQFYLIYPFLFALAQRRNRFAVLTGALLVFFGVRVLASLIGLSHGMQEHALGSAIYFFSIGHFDAFMAGALAAFYPEHLVRLRRPIGLLALGLIAAAFAFVIARIDYAALPGLSLRGIIEATRPALGAWPGAEGAMIWSYILPEVGTVALLAQAIGPGGVIKTILGWRPLVYIGQVSFGVYVWQGIVSPAYFQTLGIEPHTASLATRLVSIPIYIALLIAVAACSYTMFERRFHKRIGAGRALAHGVPVTKAT